MSLWLNIWHPTASLQITFEDGFERFARVCGQPSILLCDRGLMDGSVYMPAEDWARLVRLLIFATIRCVCVQYDNAVQLRLRQNSKCAIFRIFSLATATGGSNGAQSCGRDIHALKQTRPGCPTILFQSFRHEFSSVSCWQFCTSIAVGLLIS